MGEPLDLVIAGERAVLPEGTRSCSIGVRGGRIVDVGPLSADLPGAAACPLVRLAADEVLLPGLVDTHVHVNDPGRSDWEGFWSATRAAAAGGVTTIVDMPLNSIPPTCDVAALAEKRSAAASRCFVDVGFWGGAVPGNDAALRPLHDQGVFGFKCFLLPSGVDEFPPLELPEVEAVMRQLATWDGLLVVHAEDPSVIAHAPAAVGRRYESFLASRPRESEDLAVARLVELARRTGCRVHVVHLSSADALPMVESAKADGVRLSAETCPHYLSLAAEDIEDAATEFKCCPPIRERENRERLWDGLESGIIDLVASDHSPCTPELKRRGGGDFDAAWGGIAGLQVALPVVWTEARRRGRGLPDVVRWMADQPARHVGLAGKGRIERGCAADLVVFAPDQSLLVEPDKLHHRNPLTPYAGRALFGVVRRTFLAGRDITADVAAGSHPRGRLITRGDA